VQTCQGLVCMHKTHLLVNMHLSSQLEENKLTRIEILHLVQLSITQVATLINAGRQKHT